MTSGEYLKQLEKYLRKLPQSDYEDAMEYFTEYFADAGPENEQAVIKELGTPKQAAAELMRNLLDKKVDEREAMEKEEKQKSTEAPKRQADNQNRNSQRPAEGNQGRPQNRQPREQRDGARDNGRELYCKTGRTQTEKRNDRRAGKRDSSDKLSVLRCYDGEDGRC